MAFAIELTGAKEGGDQPLAKAFAKKEPTSELPRHEGNGSQLDRWWRPARSFLCR